MNKYIGLNTQYVRNFLKFDKNLNLLLKNKNFNNNIPKISKIQDKIQSFYQDKYVQPFIAYDAQGPWIKTLESNYIYDAGGYGMLGFGHNNDKIMNALSKRQVMANIMTPNLIHKKFTDKLSEEIGNKRGFNPYHKFMCLNSGSEANSLALTIANIHNHSNPCIINIKNSFHGRTEGPANISDSLKPTYKKHLQRFNNNLEVYNVDYNDTEQLDFTYKHLIKNNRFVELIAMEPVMGEGNPGVQINPDFYKKARDLTKEYNSLLFIDSVQAGIRCTGQLSIVDYHGIDNYDAPDLETYSKAINGGQYPLSVLALSEKASNLFQIGLYGNTMTANPRALEVAISVLDMVDNKLKDKIFHHGYYLKSKFEQLEKKYPFVNNVTGTGLLLAIHMNKILPIDKIEYDLRCLGLNVIHGGENALRFTPWFLINKQECDLIIKILDDYFDSIIYKFL